MSNDLINAAEIIGKSGALVVINTLSYIIVCIVLLVILWSLISTK